MDQELNARLAELARILEHADAETRQQVAEILDGLTWLARRVAERETPNG